MYVLSLVILQTIEFKAIVRVLRNIVKCVLILQDKTWPFLK